MAGKLVRSVHSYKDSVSGRTKTSYTFILHDWSGRIINQATWDYPVPPSNIQEEFDELAKQHPACKKPVIH